MAITPINMPVSRPPRILVLADTPALGMKMMTTQVIRGLRDRYTDAEIGVLTSSSGARFYENCPHRIHLHKVQDEGVFSNKGLHSVAPYIRAGQYDAVVSLPFQEYYYSSLVVDEGMRFPFRIGSNKILSGIMDRFENEIPQYEVFTHDVRPPCGIFAPEEYMGSAMLRYLEPFGITGQEMRPEAWSSEKDKLAVDDLLVRSGILPEDFLVTLNLRANQNHNQWRLSTLIEAVSQMSGFWFRQDLLKKYGRLVFLVNYYKPEQQHYFRNFNSALRNFSDIQAPVIGMPNNGPGELASIIARSRYVITPETGTAHVAQALDVPCTVVYINEEVARGWQLPGGRVMSIISNVEDVSPDDIFSGSMGAIFQWCRR